jgi:hypothetical protein
VIAAAKKLTYRKASRGWSATGGLDQLFSPDHRLMAEALLNGCGRGDTNFAQQFFSATVE